MIVTYRHRRKRPSKPAQAAEIKVPRIVQHTPKVRAWKVLAPDAEADAKVKAFFDRMIRPVPSEQDFRRLTLLLVAASTITKKIISPGET
jgi:hypothetical protein